MSNTDPTKKPMVNSGPREGYAVPASYKAPVLLLIYTIKSGKTFLSRKCSVLVPLIRFSCCIYFFVVFLNHMKKF